MCQELSFIRKLIGAQRHFRLFINSCWGVGGWSCGFGLGLDFWGCNGLFVLTLYHRDKDKIPRDLGRWCQSEEALPQDVSQAVRFLVPLTLSGQAKNKFTACGDRQQPTSWMLAKTIERERSQNFLLCMFPVSTFLLSDEFYKIKRKDECSHLWTFVFSIYFIKLI